MRTYKSWLISALLVFGLYGALQHGPKIQTDEETPTIPPGGR